MKRMIGWLYRNERGTVVTLVAILLVALLGMGALVLDGGYLFESRRKLVTTADAAAVAGATEWANQQLFGNPAMAPDAARAKAMEYAVSNGASPGEVTISVVEAERKVVVDIARNNILSFARLLGMNTAVTDAHAAAIAGPIAVLGEGALPIFVPKELYDSNTGDVIYLREGTPPPKDPGNFSALALGGGGANNYLFNLKNGYPGTISVGDMVDTETGNIPNKTVEGIQYRIDQCATTCDHSDGLPCTYLDYYPGCPRAVLLLVCTYENLNGKEEIEVIGFLPFFLESVFKDGGNVTITGHVIEKVHTGKVIGSDGSTGGNYGAWAVNLIQ